MGFSLRITGSLEQRGLDPPRWCVTASVQTIESGAMIGEEKGRAKRLTDASLLLAALFLGTNHVAVEGPESPEPRPGTTRPYPDQRRHSGAHRAPLAVGSGVLRGVAPGV
jgi:hypothetical protein